jgi:hypothetical protein
MSVSENLRILVKASAKLELSVYHHFPWTLILTPAQKGRLAQLLVFSPLGKCHFADQKWLHPLDFFRNSWVFSNGYLALTIEAFRLSGGSNPGARLKPLSRKSFVYG